MDFVQHVRCILMSSKGNAGAMENRKRKGRPTKNPRYNPVEIQKALTSLAVDLYEEYGEVKAVAEELEMSEIKVRKLLITAGEYESEMADEIMALREVGKTIQEICQITGLGKASVNGYLPYTKVPYNANELSLNAKRIKKYRKRRTEVDKLGQTKDIRDLWKCIVLFEGYGFKTVKGLKYKYIVKGGEIFVGRKESSKSITMSTVELAFQNALELMESVGAVTGPKKLGTLGASYLYSMFLRFGVIKC